MSLILHYIIFAFSLLAIVITSGVVLRVEKKLDISFKLILISIIIFAAGSFAELLVDYKLIPGWDWPSITKTLFIAFFTLGVFEMRTLIIGLEKRSDKN